MLSLLLFTITVPLAIASQNYQYAQEFLNKETESQQDGAFCCGKTENLIINGHFEYGNTYDYEVTNEAGFSQKTLADHSWCLADHSRCIYDHSACASPEYHENTQYLLVTGAPHPPPGSKSLIWHQKIQNLKPGKWYRFCANFRNLLQSTNELPEVTVELSTGVSRTVTIDTDQDNYCNWQQISLCFYVGSRVSVNIMLEESSLEDGSILAIDDVSVQELGDPQVTISLYLTIANAMPGIMGIVSAEDGTLSENVGLYYWFVLTLQSQSSGTFTVNWSAPRGWGNSTGSFRANRYAVGPPWSSNLISSGSRTYFPGFVFLSNTVYAIGIVGTPCCEACIANGWTYNVVYPTFFRIDNWVGGALGKGTYTRNYGLTEMDRIQVEQWVGTYEP